MNSLSPPSISIHLMLLESLQAASLHSCAIAHHLELKERSREKTITELNKKLVKLRESHAREIRSLEENV